MKVHSNGLYRINGKVMLNANLGCNIFPECSDFNNNKPKLPGPVSRGGHQRAACSFGESGGAGGHRSQMAVI